MQAHLRKHDMWGHIKIDGARVPLESHRVIKNFKFSKMPKEKGWDLKIPHFEHLEISNSLNFIQGMWNYCQKFWHFLTIDFLVRNVIKETGP